MVTLLASFFASTGNVLDAGNDAAFPAYVISSVLFLALLFAEAERHIGTQGTLKEH